jgi:predicted transcriptional regulator
MASRTTFQLLGPTEREIMEVLWQHGPRTIPQIIEVIGQTRPTAYTTIKTTTEVLLKKVGLTHFHGH